MVLRERPKRSMIETAASKERGIAVHEIAAVRKLKRKRKMTRTTRIAPMKREDRML
jgi:hypothetical protein